MGSSAARLFVFKPKIPIWVNFGGSCDGKSWYLLLPFGLFNRHRKYFMAIWSFGIFLHVLVFCTKKNLATLMCSAVDRVLPSEELFSQGQKVKCVHRRRESTFVCIAIVAALGEQRTGWPDGLLKKRPKCGQNPFCQNECIPFTAEKVHQNFELLL
jgi:hypothetical protein